MANFSECTALPVARFGSLVEYDDRTQLPSGIACVARNVRYTAQSVGTRWGFTKRLDFGGALGALGALRFLANDNTGTEIVEILGYTRNDGNIKVATPFNQASVATLTTPTFVQQANLPLVPNLYPVIVQAFNRGMIAMGNCISGQATNLIHDPEAGTLDPLSSKPFGVPWSPGMTPRVGDIVSPSTFQTYGLPVAQGIWVAASTGHLYQCTVAGTAAATQPPWPAIRRSTIVDGGVTWTEATPQAYAGLPDPAAPILGATPADANSVILPGATVYLALTYISADGESINELVTPDGIIDAGRVLVFTNGTTGPVDLQAILPAIPAELGLNGPLQGNGATAFEAYAYITTDAVPDTAKITDPTYYAQIAGGPFAAGATITLSAYPIGQALPVVNTANVAGVGNVDTGVRWMVTMFETRTEYETGWGASSPVRVNVTNDDRQIFVPYLPIGPYNTIRRICGLTVAGASKAGPYFYIDQPDVESPGFNEADVQITATTINDNTTTSAVFNFTDTYLPGASEVTDYVNRFEVPGASDIFHSKTLAQVIYTGVTGYPSGFLVSDFDDPEAVRNPGSPVQCAENDGDRTVCWRELRESQIALKENSGHAVIPTGDDPSTWAVHRLWSGSGPVGPKAIAVGIEDTSEFLIYAHRTGPYWYAGASPKLIGRELGVVANTQIQGAWKRINWAAGYKIVVRCDSTRREVRFSLPVDGATENNLTFTVSYALGWDDPIVFSPRQGKEVPNLNGRRWSIDDVDSNDAVYLPQRYQAGVPTADLSDNILIAKADGGVYTLTEQRFSDDVGGKRKGYLANWEGVPGGNPNLNVLSLHGATISAIGAGPINFYATDDKGNRFQLSNPLRRMILTATSQTKDFGRVGTMADRFGVGFDNQGVADVGFEVHTATLWIKRAFSQRRG